MSYVFNLSGSSRVAIMQAFAEQEDAMIAAEPARGSQPERMARAEIMAACLNAIPIEPSEEQAYAITLEFDALEAGGVVHGIALSLQADIVASDPA